MTKNLYRLFFKERLVELFHKDTIDSFRIRNHNAFTLLIECKEVVMDWQNANLKNYDTVKHCIEEVQEAVKKDVILTFKICSKTIFDHILSECSNRGEKERNIFKKLIYYIDAIVCENKEHYLYLLFQKIDYFVCSDYEEETFPTDKFIEFDHLISALATQLMYIGFSKYYIFHLSNTFDVYQFEDSYSNFKQTICNRTKLNKAVIVKLAIGEKENKIVSLMQLVNEVPKKYVNEQILMRFASYLRPNKNFNFFIFETTSDTDSYSTAKKAREIIAKKLDMLHLNNNLLKVEIPKYALVTYKNDNGQTRFEYVKEFYIDGTYNNNDPTLFSTINSLMEKPNIDKEVSMRLSSALRHLRIGNCQSDIEQQFVNYWIALEFIFSSAEANESTFSRVKTNIINIFVSCYIKRNILYLDSLLKKENILSTEETIFDATTLKKAESNSKISVLLLYRLKIIEPIIIGNSDKRKNYIKAHETNLAQHISRIYRLRNKLIHEAAIKQNIANITSDLRYYLVFVINQMISYYNEQSTKSDKKLCMEDMFFEYDMVTRCIKENFNLDILRDVHFDNTYLS